MRRVNVMVGRFQPLTNGHLKCVETAWEKKGVPTVLCMVNTKEEKTAKNENQDDDQKMANHNSAQKTKNGEKKVEVKKKPSVCAKGYMAIPALLVGIVGLGIFPLGINLYVSIWVILCVCACVWVIVDRNRENIGQLLRLR